MNKDLDLHINRTLKLATNGSHMKSATLKNK